MILDLRTILDGWEFEPGKISVRKIIGRDGREKIQTRVDLGLLQFELAGRPDGQRPHECDTYLDYCERKLRDFNRHSNREDAFLLTPEDCRELKHEAHMFYQRFLSLFVLEEFEAVACDTLRNLRTLDLLHEYGPSESDRDALEPQRAYLLMMNARANVYAAVRDGDHDRALRQIERGIDAITALRAEEDGVTAEPCPELEVLENLRDEVIVRMPADSPLRLRQELEEALAEEDYERAAKLRDRMKSARLS